MLVRVADTTTGDTWPQLRQGLERMHLGESAGRAGASPSAPRPPRQRELRALEIKEPQLALDVQAVRARR